MSSGIAKLLRYSLSLMPRTGQSTVKNTALYPASATHTDQVSKRIPHTQDPFPFSPPLSYSPSALFKILAETPLSLNIVNCIASGGPCHPSCTPFTPFPSSSPAAAATSSNPVVAYALNPIHTPTRAAARAVAASPSGWASLWLAAGAKPSGKATRWPKMVVDVSTAETSVRMRGRIL